MAIDRLQGALDRAVLRNTNVHWDAAWESILNRDLQLQKHVWAHLSALCQGVLEYHQNTHLNTGHQVPQNREQLIKMLNKQLPIDDLAGREARVSWIGQERVGNRLSHDPHGPEWLIQTIPRETIVQFLAMETPLRWLWDMPARHPLLAAVTVGPVLAVYFFSPNLIPRQKGLRLTRARTPRTIVIVSITVPREI